MPLCPCSRIQILAAMDKTILSLTSKSSPVLVHPDVDTHIVGFLSKFEVCRHCMGEQTIRRNGGLSLPEEYIQSLPSYFRHYQETLRRCSFCKCAWLCPYHFKSAVKNCHRYTGKTDPNMAMCHGCCWMHM